MTVIVTVLVIIMNTEKRIVCVCVGILLHVLSVVNLNIATMLLIREDLSVSTKML